MFTFSRTISYFLAGYVTKQYIGVKEKSKIIY